MTQAISKKSLDEAQAEVAELRRKVGKVIHRSMTTFKADGAGGAGAGAGADGADGAILRKWMGVAQTSSDTRSFIREEDHKLFRRFLAIIGVLLTITAGLQALSG